MPRCFPVDLPLKVDPRLLAQARIDAPSRMQARITLTAESWMVIFRIESYKVGPPFENAKLVVYNSNNYGLW